MEPQIIDYYNEMPFMINVIDKMNEELNTEQKEVKKLNNEIEDYKDNIIFDLFFNHGIDIETQKDLKKKVYHDNDDIFICKDCNEFVYEPYCGGDSIKYNLYMEIREAQGGEEHLDICEGCFHDCEYDVEALDFPVELIPGIGDISEIKMNTKLWRVDTYIYLIKTELDECKSYDEKIMKYDELIDTDKYIERILKYKSTVEVLIIQSYIYDNYI